MKKGIIIAASILLVAGLAIFFGALASVGFRFEKLSTVKMHTNTYAAEGVFHSIEIEEDTANIDFAVSEDGTCSVVCREPEKTAHTVTVEDGTLRIAAADQSDWSGFFDLSFEPRKVTVYLPENAYTSLSVNSHTGNADVPEWLGFERIGITCTTGKVSCRASASDGLTIKTSTGNVQLEGVSASRIECITTTGNIRMQRVSCEETLSIGVSTGNVNLSDLTAKTIETTGSTGSVRLTNVLASESLSIERSTGNIVFDGCDAPEIKVKTSTGNVTGTLRSPKIFQVKTSTGNVLVPDSEPGGKCGITTSTGNVSIRIQTGA